MRLAVTGLSGILGSHFKKKSRYNENLLDIYHSKPSKNARAYFQIDLLNLADIEKNLKIVKPDVLVHFAGSTHIDICQKENGNKKGKVWQLNVEATKRIVNFCRSHDTHLVFISTEGVFSGGSSFYSENTVTTPISWYGITKATAERYVSTLSSSTIIRAVTIYDFFDKKTLLGNIYNKVVFQKPLRLVSDHFLTPTYIDDIVVVIDMTINQTITGILHVGSQNMYTVKDIAHLIGRKIGFRVEPLIQEVTLAEYFGYQRSELRTKYACLDTQKTRNRLKILFTEPSQALQKLKLVNS